MQALACRIDRRGTAGRTTAHDNEVIRTLDFFRGEVFHAEVFFEFVEQLREFTATAVHEFFSTEHGGHTLEVKLVHLVLEEGAVHDSCVKSGWLSAMILSACTTSGQLVQVSET